MKRAALLLTLFALPALATPPKLLSPAEIAALAGDASAWADQKSQCDGLLGQIIDSGYVGFDWHDAAIAESTCYNVAKLLGLPAATVQAYSDKALAMMRVLARDQAYGTPSPTQELLAVGDGATFKFTLRMPVAAGKTIHVWLAPLTSKTFTYGGPVTTLCNSGYCFDPVVKIGSYVRSADYHERYPDGLSWLNGNHPANGASFTALIADQSFAAVSGATVSGTTLTLPAAPSTTQAVFVEYLGPNEQQTGNAMGGVDSCRPDSHFPMRSMNVGLAWAFDSMRESADLTAALRSEYALLLAQQVDDYMATTGANPYLNTPLSNYYLEGELTGTVCTAYAIDDDRSTTPGGIVLKDLARQLITAAADALDQNIPGGYGFEGTYTDGSDTDLLNDFHIWKNATGEDLPATLEWTQDVVPTTIHGIKPDRATFYDGGDWNDLPATPLTGVLASFAKYQADHPMAPFARQALADVGSPVSGATQDYKAAFPLSWLAKGTGVLYARSGWDTGAVWLSMAVGPIFSLGHEHLDRGHITIQRGADYLLKDAGQYGTYDTLPWHNTLGFGDGDLIYQCDGNDGGSVEPPRYLEGGAFVYGREDVSKSWCSGVDGVTRTLVYLRPDFIVVHDQALTSSASTKKQFNANFGAAIGQSGSVFSATVGGSKLFMRSLVPASPSPVITPSGTTFDAATGTYALHGFNYRVSTSGQKAETFLHVFQAAPAAQAQMAATAYVQSSDGKAQGAAADAGAKRWVVLSSMDGAQLGSTLAYAMPLACPCSHVVGDLAPDTNYSVSVYGAGGGAPIATLSAATGPAGVLSFETPDAAAAQVTLAAGSAVVDATPPSVALAAPASGATVSGKFILAATASDAGTGVTRVQFFVDGAMVGDDTTAPFTFSWDSTPVSNGAHAFSAKAFDGAGNSATSASVTATVSNSGTPASADTTPPAAPTGLRVR